MHRTNRSRWQHAHNFERDSSVAERRTRVVVRITAAMMVVEIAAGIAFGSMALLADGWHMSTHVAAFLITALAYCSLALKLSLQPLLEAFPQELAGAVEARFHRLWGRV